MKLIKRIFSLNKIPDVKDLTKEKIDHFVVFYFNNFIISSF